MGGVFFNNGPIKLDGAINIVNNGANGAWNSNNVRVPCSSDPVTLLVTNGDRKGCVIYNHSKEDLLIKFGPDISLMSMTVRIGPGSVYEMGTPTYLGDISGVWSNLDTEGHAHITELI